MFDITKENRESYKSNLISFYNCITDDYNKGKPVNEVVDAYLDDLIAMNEGMTDYYNHLKEIEEENRKLLLEIKRSNGKTFYKYVCQIIEESEGIDGLAEIVDKPTGTFQEGYYGRQINGIWVEQWSRGIEGDSWGGYVYIQLDVDKYLKLPYSM
jgi:hypothetical protein